MLKVWLHKAGAQKDSREPLSPSLLKGFWFQWMALCLSTLETVLFHAAALIAFFVALRISELVAGSRRDASVCATHFADVRLGPEIVQIILHCSKPDQRGKRALISLGSCEDHALGPLLAVHQYLEVWGICDGNLFSPY